MTYSTLKLRLSSQIKLAITSCTSLLPMQLLLNMFSTHRWRSKGCRGWGRGGCGSPKGKFEPLFPRFDAKILLEVDLDCHERGQLTYLVNDAIKTALSEVRQVRII